jgi:hypothetical protein
LKDGLRSCFHIAKLADRGEIVPLVNGVSNLLMSFSDALRGNGLEGKNNYE